MAKPYWEIEKGWDTGGNCLTCGEAGRCQCKHPLFDPSKNVIGDIEFTAIRATRPIPHWKLRIDPTGEVWDSGVAGIDGSTRPKLWASLKDLFRHIGYERFRRDTLNTA